MKQLHRPDLFAWSAYDEALRVDFNSVLWTRERGNVLVDPLPLAPCDEKHLDELGGAAWIVVTNSAHVRGAREISARTGATVLGPRGERGSLPIPCERWLGDGDEPFAGLRVRELHGSKTDGELALVLEETTVIFGDLVRSMRADTLVLLPAHKLRDPSLALESVQRVRTLHPRISNVLVGDGWCVFRHGAALLDELVGGGAG
jgi:glyoxylase-like metal-dependent hydrolase (beta-lactamase superfamily II)